MRLAPLLLCLPLCAKPLSIASDIGNKEGFLDFLGFAIQQDTGLKILWQPLEETKRLCGVSAYLVSKNALSTWHLLSKGGMPAKGTALFQESFVLLGDQELAPLFTGKSPKAVLLELTRPALAKSLKIVRARPTPYKPTDLVLMSQRLYLQQPPTLSVLYQPLNMRYFWLSPCHKKDAQPVLKWLQTHKEIFTDFRINYQNIFTPLEDGAHD
ncbi:hypothetical protein NHP190003_10350 [Helicobacter sp. NHP19-003]|uniref:Solute-binding protein family 3/N-terminal domain-containing protein n=1 Tax=Helicobacter gastrocanis TaxID=2849641 RepID=A0ABM7SAW7_9HELI|nr:hypothetical protein [Helicobacter sp. NHP19-003]BCZ17753.1 hypothetical protein NHP190003_10350 [Helicobacter sp. NHP19-003]